MAHWVLRLLAFVLFFGGVVVFVAAFDAPGDWRIVLAALGIVVLSSGLAVPRWLMERLEER